MCMFYAPEQPLTSNILHAVRVFVLPTALRSNMPELIES